MRALFGEGIGFAIPVDSIRAAMPELLAGRQDARAQQLKPPFTTVIGPIVVCLVCFSSCFVKIY